MTCIVGLVRDGGGVTIGGDSTASTSYIQFALAASMPKVFRRGDFLFGCSGSVRMAQLIAHAFTPPMQDTQEDTCFFLATRFVDRLRDCLKNGGHAKKDKEQEEIDGSILVGYDGRLFCIHSDYQVIEPSSRYYAIGFGQEVALGALYALEHLGGQQSRSAEAQVRLALAAASTFSRGVGGSLVIETLESDTAQESETA